MLCTYSMISRILMRSIHILGLLTLLVASGAPLAQDGAPREKRILPSASAPPAALRALTVDGRATAAAMKQQIEGLLTASKATDMVALTLSAPARAVGGQVELLGSDGAVAFDLRWLKEQVGYSDAGFALIALNLRWSAPPPESMLDQVQVLAGVRKDVMVLDGATLGLKSGRCPGQSRGACALASALTASADTSGDSAVQADELIAAVQGALARDGGKTTDLRASGWLSPFWQIPLPKQVAAASPSPKQKQEVTKAREEVPPAQAAVPIELCLRANDRLVPLDHVFQDYDRLSLSIRAPESGFIALGSMGPTGTTHPLFPDPRRPGEDGRITGGATALIPAEGEMPIEFGPPSGTERLALVWSRAPVEVAVVEAALRRAAPPSATRPSAAGASQVTMVQRDARTKDITRRPVETASDDGTCAVIEAVGGADLWVMDLVLMHQAGD